MGKSCQCLLCCILGLCTVLPATFRALASSTNLVMWCPGPASCERRYSKASDVVGLFLLTMKAGGASHWLVTKIHAVNPGLLRKWERFSY